ncbi:hypothetical protein N480_21065 [Pseudoalteromonas luteoviolacea S2607]|nr:hypothetical protein N480_21065 [Pseudoalteromonas luteoviolacea S2607]
MFESISLKAIYYVIGYMSLPLFFLALVVGWRSINARCLISLLIIVELVDTAMIDTVYGWGNNYYLWIFIYAFIYLYVVLARRLIVKKLRNISVFCNDVYENYYFSKQEGALILIYVGYILAIFIALCEVKMFEYDIVDSFPYLKHIFSPILTILCLIETLLVLKLASRTVPIDEHVLALKRRRKFERKRLTNMSEKKDR